MNARRRTIKEFMPKPEKTANLVSIDQGQSPECRSQRITSTKAEMPVDHYRTAPRLKVKELAFGTQSTFEWTHQLQTNNKWNDSESGQNARICLSLTGSMEDDKENFKTPHFQEVNYHEERVRIYRNNKFVSEEEWFACIFGDLADDESEGESDSSSSWLGNEDLENDPQYYQGNDNIPGDMSIDSDVSTATNFSTETLDPANIDEVVLPMMTFSAEDMRTPKK